ncbi:MAG: PAS domain S-box protein [Bacteriovoracaceae bacterium]|nr:PAS domain S-box protein [Bacteriovoracaceae bacterium]
MDIWNLWNADYWWSGWAKALIATASVGTGIYLFRIRHIIVQVIEESRLAEQQRLDLEVLTRTLEERVKERTQLLKTITDNASSCLFMLDKNGCPTLMNPAAEKLTGFQLEEIRHKPLHESIGANAELVKVTDQTDVFRDRFGRVFDVSYSVAPIETNGEITGSVMEFRDISEQKKAEHNI